METKQAMEIIRQGINIALGAGAFKSTQDVAIIHTAFETINRLEEASRTEVVSEPIKKKDK